MYVPRTLFPALLCRRVPCTVYHRTPLAIPTFLKVRALLAGVSKKQKNAKEKVLNNGTTSRPILPPTGIHKFQLVDESQVVDVCTRQRRSILLKNMLEVKGEAQQPVGLRPPLQGALGLSSNHEQACFPLASSSSSSSSLLASTTAAPGQQPHYQHQLQQQHHQPNRSDEVTINVCDEARKVNKYFFCKRSVLVTHMKYFERFLAENESSFDLDISVHCDVEIFEWLMTYIHEPTVRPQLDKSIVVSILISSEFLQMDALVDICLHDISTRLNEIIKLPIDLSCISDKLVNRLAAMTSPKILAQTRDRKDKILNKLYKRRVEIDFSRKGGNSRIAVGGTSNASIVTTTNAAAAAAVSTTASLTTNRAIAASLTCCRNCGLVYLDSYVSELTCRKASTAIDFRGGLVRRHTAIMGWSLTAYLKSLHVGGMSWEAIYWHVWAACVVLRPPPPASQQHSVHDRHARAVGVGEGSNASAMISALEVDRYHIDINELHVYSRPKPPGQAVQDFQADVANDVSQKAAPFTLSCEYDNTTDIQIYKMYPRGEFTYDTRSSFAGSAGAAAADVSATAAAVFAGVLRAGGSASSNSAGVTPTLSPLRPPEVLTDDIFDLLRSQAKLVEGGPHRPLLEASAQAIVAAAAAAVAGNTQPLPPPGKANAGIAAFGATRSATLVPPQPKARTYSNFAAMLWGEADSRARIKAQCKLAKKGLPAADAAVPDGAALADAAAAGAPRGAEAKDRGRSRSASRTRKPSKTSISRPSSKGAGKGRRKRAPSVSSAGSAPKADPQSDAEAAGGTGNGAGGSGGAVPRAASADMADVPADVDGDRDSDNSDIDVGQPARRTLAGGSGGGGGGGDGGLRGGTTLRRAHHRQAKAERGTGVAVGDGTERSASPLTVAGGPGPGTGTGTGQAGGDRPSPRVPEAPSAAALKDLATLMALTPDAHKLAESGRGAVRGVWLTEHPLQVQPVAFLDAINKVNEPSTRSVALGLSTDKLLLWQLDLLRQHDDQCMDRYEAFLASQRSPAPEEQIKVRAKAVAATPHATFSAALIAQHQQLLQQQMQQQQMQQQGGSRAPTRRRETIAGHHVNVANFEYWKDKGRLPTR